jgi:hypothetical protein
MHGPQWQQQAAAWPEQVYEALRDLLEGRSNMDGIKPLDNPV